MRPRRYYATFHDNRVSGIYHGAAAARNALQGRRRYRAFTTRQAAEEFAAWWNYIDPLTNKPRRKTPGPWDRLANTKE